MGAEKRRGEGRALPGDNRRFGHWRLDLRLNPHFFPTCGDEVVIKRLDDRAATSAIIVPCQPASCVCHQFFAKRLPK